jgi:hypothetical protein
MTQCNDRGGALNTAPLPWDHSVGLRSHGAPQFTAHLLSRYAALLYADVFWLPLHP